VKQVGVQVKEVGVQVKEVGVEANFDDLIQGRIEQHRDDVQLIEAEQVV
jgi:hypothetical protein